MAAVALLNTPLFDDPTLQVYYRFEDNANDSKNSNNGTGDNVTYSLIDGKFQKGVLFTSGGSSNISVPYNIPYGSFTINFWLKGTATSFPGIFVSYDSGESQVLGMTGSGDMGVPVNFTIFATGNGPTQVIGTIPVYDGFFHMISCVYDVDTGDQSLYVDGELDGTTTFTDPFSVSASMFLGDPFSDGNESMDDFSIFTSALTAQNISDLYTGNFPPPEVSSNPSFLLNFI